MSHFIAQSVYHDLGQVTLITVYSTRVPLIPGLHSGGGKPGARAGAVSTQSRVCLEPSDPQAGPRQSEAPGPSRSLRCAFHLPSPLQKLLQGYSPKTVMCC